jgi:hypothetical protein
MTIVPFAAAGLLLALALLSFRRIAALPLPVNRRILLGLLRLFLLTALALAFFEPVLTFDRLSPPRQPVPVLLDVSQSMRLFSPQESIEPALRKIEAWNAAHADPGHRFALYRFGDSLRRLPDLRPGVNPIDLSDRRSFLPEAAGEGALRRSAAMLIISDGNWSNAVLPLESFADKNVWYLPLPAVRPAPFLKMEEPVLPPASPADSPLTVTVALDGYCAAGGGETLSVSAVENGISIAGKAVGTGSGPFHLDVPLSLRRQVPGRHLYRFTARSAGAALRCSRYALHTALPGHFIFAATHAAPSLDERFFTLAFDRDRDFLEQAPASPGQADLALVFDAGRDPTTTLYRLKRNGTILFIGGFPGASEALPGTSATSLLAVAGEEAGNSLSAGLDLSRLPPALRYYIDPHQSFRASSVFLAASVARPGKTDTIPVVFSADRAGRHCLVCAASGIWRWDFAPLAQGDEESAFGFSRRLVACVKDMLTAALSRGLLLYPAAPLSENDSFSLRILFPADLPIPSPVGLTCTFVSDRLKVDTSFSLTATGGSWQSVRFGPLPEGAYRLAVAGTAGSRTVSFTDSLFVDPDQSETSVTGQNTALLGELAQPLPGLTDSVISSVFFNAAQAAGARVHETIPIRRGWLLLIAILGVLGVEWVARRVMRLD